tara:strand:- start:187 stop:738 length:552 start_codon:yes stop_codon:yes gene_type:complete
MSTYEAIRYNFNGANVTALNGSNIATGTVAEARVADLATSKITSGTFADARLSSSSVTQHVDLTALSASNLTSGTIPNDRYGSPTFNGSNLTNLPSSAPTSAQVGTAIAGMNYYDVGTYGLVNMGNSGNTFQGTTMSVSGGNLKWASTGGSGNNNNMSGTWEMHGFHGTAGGNKPITVWKRIS